MNIKIKTTFALIGLTLTGLTLQSCLGDNSKDPSLELAVVTAKTNESNKPYFQLDQNTILIPEDLDKIFDGKEVRAVINYSQTNEDDKGAQRNIKLYGADSIRTKNMLWIENGNIPESVGEMPIEVVDDWLTCLEDGYLTLRVRAMWSSGTPAKPHTIDLLGGLNSENNYEVELRHNDNGDNGGFYRDALIAFKLDGLDFSNGQKLTLKWKSYDGTTKSVTFKPWSRAELTQSTNPR